MPESKLPIITPVEHRRIRLALGWGPGDEARFMGLGKWGYQTVTKWETGEIDSIPGPVQVLMRAIADSPAVREHFGLTLTGKPVEAAE